MKLKNLLVILLVIISTNLFAQTKLIAHKSHSGSNTNFMLALENNLFDLKDSNFGVAPIREIKKAQLDSLIFLTDTSVVMITSEYCGWVERHIKKPKKINEVRKWQAGKDTVYHHDLFSRKNSVEKIKKTLTKDYFFRNSADSVKFINHDVPLKVEEETKQKSEITQALKTPKTKKDLRKEKRKAKKEERKYNRWAKKNCDCDCDCNEEKPIKVEEQKETETKSENENTNQNENPPKEQNQNDNNFNNTLTYQYQMLSPIGGIGLCALLIGLFVSRWQNRF